MTVPNIAKPFSVTRGDNFILGLKLNTLKRRLNDALVVGATDREVVNHKAAAQEIKQLLHALERESPLAKYPLDRLGVSHAATSSFDDISNELYQGQWAPSTSTTSTEAAFAPMRNGASVRTGSVRVCQGKHCRKRGSAKVEASFLAATHGAPIDVSSCECLGHCKKGPAVCVEVDGVRKITYSGVSTGCAAQIVTSQFGLEAHYHDY